MAEGAAARSDDNDDKDDSGVGYGAALGEIYCKWERGVKDNLF